MLFDNKTSSVSTLSSTNNHDDGSTAEKTSKKFHKKIFPAVWASVWSKIKGGGAGPAPGIRLCCSITKRPP